MVDEVGSEEMFPGEAAPVGLTVEQFDQTIQKMAKLREDVEELEKKASDKNKELNRLKETALAYLRENKRDSYQSPYGTVYISETWSVKIPKDEGAKTAFFEYLTKRGLFYEYATVNSNSLKSFFLAERATSDDPMTFTLPGIEPAEMFEKIGLRKPTK